MFCVRVTILPACMHTGLHTWYLWGPEQGARCPHPKVTDGCKLPCGGWAGFLTIEPFLEPQKGLPILSTDTTQGLLGYLTHHLLHFHQYFFCLHHRNKSITTIPGSCGAAVMGNWPSESKGCLESRVIFREWGNNREKDYESKHGAGGSVQRYHTC